MSVRSQNSNLSDEFLLELKKLQETDSQIREEIEIKIHENFNKNQDIIFSSSIIENINIQNPDPSSKIYNLFDSMSKSIDNLERINRADLYHKNSHVDEIVKRSSLLEEIKLNYKKLRNYYEGSLVSSHVHAITRKSRASSVDKYEIALNVKDKPLNPQELANILDNQKKKQDSMIDEFSGLIKKIHSANKEIENELINQNPMINKIDNRVDNTKNRIQNTTSKLDKYLQKSSNCCMFSFIAVEIMVVILLLLN